MLGESALLAGLSLIPTTGTVILTSTFATRRLLDRVGVKRLLLIGLASMGLGQVWFSFMRSGGGYVVSVLPGLLLTAWGIALALPSASIGATTGVDRREQGLAGGLLTTGQQLGAAVGLALPTTTAAARTAQTGSLATGFDLSYLTAVGLVLIAMLLVATQLNH